MYAWSRFIVKVSQSAIIPKMKGPFAPNSDKDAITNASHACVSANESIAIQASLNRLTVLVTISEAAITKNAIAAYRKNGKTQYTFLTHWS
jgi:hypothetical protein